MASGKGSICAGWYNGDTAKEISDAFGGLFNMFDISGIITPIAIDLYRWRLL